MWAPNADQVSVIGDWNGWRAGADRRHPVRSSGVWEGFVPGVRTGALYKYAIRNRTTGYRVDKADPFGFAAETRPSTAGSTPSAPGPRPALCTTSRSARRWAPASRSPS